MCHDHPMQEDAGRYPLPMLAAIGVAAGLLSGLFGVGGGIVMVPALVLLGMGQHRAHAASLGAIVPIATVGAIVFGGASAVDLPAAAVLAAGGVVGVVAVGGVPARRLGVVVGRVGRP